ncbi:MAG: uroporphyrinogen-III C-methyltransferase [Spirochaetia bacterium]
MALESTSRGIVYIVGAGPGDEGLITTRGVEALQRAEVVIYDYLANPVLLDNCPESCERICVGKMAGKHSLPQEEINALLVARALEGKIVVRLKGGDPFVFGRGGEEALELARQDIPFAVVPGITSALAAAAYAGIPLTHRGMASTVVLITGHEDPKKADSDVDWDRLAVGAGTLAIYMGVKNLPGIVNRLTGAGRPADTPAALIQWGTLNRQKTLTGTLADIAALADARGFDPPAILVVGEVVDLREKLRWFDTRSLVGRKIVVTRSRNQASDLSRGLRELGAEVLEFPSIAIMALENLAKLDQVFKELSSFSWIVFTSVNGVQVFFSRLEQAGLDARALSTTKVAAIGTGTSCRLRGFGIRADLIPQRFTSEAVLETFAELKTDYSKERILFPGSEIGRELLPAGLEDLGAEVVRVPIYRNLIPKYSEEEVDSIFNEEPDLVTFTSSSTVTNLAEILRSCGRERYLRQIRGACIGPVTTRSARDQGIQVLVESSPHTISALIRAIKHYFQAKEQT